MSTSIIKVEGFVANEPQIRHTQDGTPVLSVSVPHQRSQKNEQTGQWEGVGPTAWHEIALFGQDAERFAPHIHKGTRLIAEGFAEVRVWESNGKTGATISVKRPRVALIPRLESSQAPAVTSAGPAPDAESSWWTPAGDEEPF